jgi:hypothetical protein
MLEVRPEAFAGYEESHPKSGISIGYSPDSDPGRGQIALTDTCLVLIDFHQSSFPPAALVQSNLTEAIRFLCWFPPRSS